MGDVMRVVVEVRADLQGARAVPGVLLIDPQADQFGKGMVHWRRRDLGIGDMHGGDLTWLSLAVRSPDAAAHSRELARSGCAFMHRVRSCFLTRTLPSGLDARWF